MFQVVFYDSRAQRVKDQTFATRYDALAAITAWEERDARNTCHIIADHNLPRV